MKRTMRDIDFTDNIVCCAVTHSDNMALSSNIGHVKRSAVVKSVSRWKVNLGKKDRMFIINRQQKDFYMLFMIDISSLFNSVLFTKF